MHKPNKPTSYAFSQQEREDVLRLAKEPGFEHIVRALSQAYWYQAEANMEEEGARYQYRKGFRDGTMEFLNFFNRTVKDFELAKYLEVLQEDDNLTNNESEPEVHGISLGASVI